MTWPEGPFGKTVAGEVAFPWGKNYRVDGHYGSEYFASAPQHLSVG